MSGERLTANDRVRRLLTIVPWIAEHDGPRIREVCKRFGLTKSQLMADLEVVFMVGLYPFTPDELIDVVVEGDRVWIRLADYFARPLRLTPEQGLALVAAGSSLLAVEGADPDGPLARGLAKLASVLGVDLDGVQVRLADAEPEVLALLREAVEGRRQLELAYYSYGRDRHTVRVVDPHRVSVEAGQWYLAAHCHLVDAPRLFRVDRIERVALLDTTFEAPDGQPLATATLPTFTPAPGDPRITLELQPSAQWVLEQYPIESRTALADGAVRATLAVSAVGWLERLLVRLGPAVQVVDADPPLDVAIGRAAAERIADRYHRQ